MKTHRYYYVWKSMLRRCQDPKAFNYPRYGGRGIYVCGEWQDFATFCADMGDRPPGTSIERLNNNGPYSKDNCVWATPKQQANNRHTNRRLTLNGVTLNHYQWAEKIGISAEALDFRISNWPPDRWFDPPGKYGPKRGTKMSRALTINGKTQNHSEWAKEIGISRHALYLRIKNGWTPEQLLAPRDPRGPKGKKTI